MAKYICRFEGPLAQEECDAFFEELYSFIEQHDLRKIITVSILEHWYWPDLEGNAVITKIFAILPDEQWIPPEEKSLRIKPKEPSTVDEPFHSTAGCQFKGSTHICSADTGKPSY